MEVGVLALSLLSGVAAVSSLAAQQMGVLIGFQGDHGAYRTMWLVVSPDTATVVAEVPDIITPRADGFWRVGVVTLCNENGSHMVVWQTPLSRRPVVSGGRPCPDAAADSAEDTAAISVQDTSGAAVQACDASEAEILFVSPGYIADVYTDMQTDGCEPRGGHWQDRNNVRALADTEPLNLTQLFGDAVGRDYDAAVTRGFKQLSRESNCPAPEPEDHDLTSWGIRHARGAWRPVAMENSLGGECEIEGEMSLALPPSVTGETGVPVSRASLARAIPGLTDYFAAPGGAYLVALAEPRYGVQHLLAYTMSAGAPVRKLLDLEWFNRGVVMAQWAKGRYVAVWGDVLRGIRDHPLPPPGP